MSPAPKQDSAWEVSVGGKQTACLMRNVEVPIDSQFSKKQNHFLMCP